MENEDNVTRLARVPKVYDEFKKLCRKGIYEYNRKNFTEIKEEPNLQTEKTYCAPEKRGKMKERKERKKERKRKKKHD